MPGFFVISTTEGVLKNDGYTTTIQFKLEQLSTLCVLLCTIQIKKKNYLLAESHEFEMYKETFLITTVF